MTLVLKLNLDMVKMPLCTLNEVPHLSGLEVSLPGQIQTQRQTRVEILPTRVRGW